MYASDLKINSKNALLYDLTYEKMLYEKNIDERIPNASTTKILTAIVAYENSNMEEVVEIGEKPPAVGGSKINLRKGDKVKMDSLMKGLLISSGNDAAIAIAEHVGGSVEMFCELMNKKARELGAENTNFVTPHGLDNESHYSTARDLLVFSKYFMQIPYLSEIANTEKIAIKINDYEKELRATNEMLFMYEGVNGIKTGYTSKAGRCLITSIESGDRVLISMVFGCDSKNQRTEETQKLILYGYNNFEEVDVCERIRKKFEIRVKKAVNEKIEMSINGKRKILLKCGEKNNLRYEYQIPTVLTAPILPGSEIGKIIIYNKNEYLTELSLRAPYLIKRKEIFEFFSEIIKKQNVYVEVNV